MDAIFGREPHGNSELFAPENSIMMSNRTARHFSRGNFIIIPLLPDTATSQEIEQWHAHDAKDYKIRVINPEGKGMGITVAVGSQRTFNSLDGEKVQFKSDYRLSV